MSKESAPDRNLEYITPPSTEEALKELLQKMFDGFRNLFEGTELASFFDMALDEVGVAQDQNADEQSIEDMLADPALIDRYMHASVGELFMQNQRKPGFFSMLFLKNERGFRKRHRFNEGEKLTCGFLGNKEAEQQIGLADIIPDDEVAVISITEKNGPTRFGRRIIDGGKVYYAESTKDGVLRDGEKTYLTLHDGDTIQVLKRQAVSQKFKNYSAKYYEHKAVELRSISDKQLRAKDPTSGNYQSPEARDAASQDSVRRAGKAYAYRRSVEGGRWGVACYRIARDICYNLTGLRVEGGTPPKLDYGKGVQGKDGVVRRWPNLTGKYAEDLARSGVPIGTAFHMSASKDYQSMRGSNHWFTLTGFDKQGNPLFADQGGVTQSINQIYGVGRPLLAVYYP